MGRMARISDDCANKLCGLVAGTMLIGGGLAVGGGLLPGVAEATVGAVGLAASVLRRGGQEPSKVYARMSRQVAQGVQQQLDAEMPDWAERADARAAIARLPIVADAIRFEAEAVVAEGLKADGIVRLLMLKAAVIEPLFHPDTGNHSYRQILSAALSETFRVLRADPDFWASLRPDIDEAVFARLDEVIGQQAAMLDRLGVVDATTRRTEGKVDDVNAVQAIHGAKLDQILAALSVRDPGAIAAADEAGIPRSTIIKLARRILPTVEDADTALRELEHAVAIAIRVAEEGRHGTNLGGFIDAVLARVANLSSNGRFEEAAAAADDAFLTWEREEDTRQAEEDERRQRSKTAGIRLLRSAYEQDVLARNPVAAAERLVRMIDLEHGDADARHAALLAQQNARYEEGRDRGTSLPLEIAIRLAELGLERARDADERGALWNRMGNALQELGTRDGGTARLEKAVEALNFALEERTRERAPFDWAMTHNNLGNVLLILGERNGGTERLEEAIAAYRSALREFSYDKTPIEWAMTKNNLGNALQVLGEREIGTGRLMEAVEAFRSALVIRTRERFPLDWAMTQHNLGNAFEGLGQRESGTRRLKQAVEAYKLALQERTFCRVPPEWAKTQISLGNALQALGERETGTMRFEEAVDALNSALSVYTREDFPLYWAMTKNNLGNAFCSIGERGHNTDYFHQAINAYEDALMERTRIRVPLDWAATENNLGNVFFILGEITRGRSFLEKAVTFYRSSLQERTRDRVPLDWGRTTMNLVRTLLAIGEITRERNYLVEALNEIGLVPMVFQAAGVERLAGHATALRERILTALSR